MIVVSAETLCNLRVICNSGVSITVIRLMVLQMQIAHSMTNVVPIVLIVAVVVSFCNRRNSFTVLQFKSYTCSVVPVMHCVAGDVSEF